jgi:hypothetical protein
LFETHFQGSFVCLIVNYPLLSLLSEAVIKFARWLESCRYKKKAEGAWRLWGDWKAAYTKRKQKELGDCSIDNVCFWQLLRGNGRKNSRSWIVFGTSSSRGQFSGPRQTDGQTSEIIYSIASLFKVSWVSIFYTCELWNLVGVFGTIGRKVVMTSSFKSCLSLSYPQRDNIWIHAQPIGLNEYATI